MGNCESNNLYMRRQLRMLKQQMAALAGVVTVRRYGGDYQQGGVDPCGGYPKYCPPSLVNPATEAAIKSGARVFSFVTAPDETGIGSLTAGTSRTFTLVASNGLGRAVALQDLIATLTGAGQDLDSLSFVVSVSGIIKLDFQGGVFSRSNANGCSTSCGLGFCLGPIESATVTITNDSAVTTGATDKLKLRMVSIYPGEPGYAEMCGECITPGGPAPADGPHYPAGATPMMEV